jgi:hypothetical protein
VSIFFSDKKNCFLWTKKFGGKKIPCVNKTTFAIFWGNFQLIFFNHKINEKNPGHVGPTTQENRFHLKLQPRVR